jgi:hypothetical protein
VLPALIYSTLVSVVCIHQLLSLSASVVPACTMPGTVPCCIFGSLAAEITVSNQVYGSGFYRTVVDLLLLNSPSGLQVSFCEQHTRHCWERVITECCQLCQLHSKTKNDS